MVGSRRSESAEVLKGSSQFSVLGSAFALPFCLCKINKAGSTFMLPFFFVQVIC
jgi:hypothetical protein